MAQEQQDVDTLKRRGRRRLVGAVALALLAVIVLPMVFDQEPQRTVPQVTVRIPGEDEAPFKPKPPATKKVEENEAAALPPKQEVPAKPAGEQYVVAVGAFANPDSVVAQLKAARMPHYTE